jgi:hypothetical protein
LRIRAVSIRTAAMRRRQQGRATAIDDAHGLGERFNQSLIHSKLMDQEMRVARLVAAIIVLLAGVSDGQAQTKAFLLYGGKGNETFLGCLNCGQYGSGSVCNKYGQHGSPYETDSIWNKYGTFGSQYSWSSPWNEYTSSAPVIVDKDGNFYGHFSANEFHTNRSRMEWVDRFFKVAKKMESRSDARDMLCGE